MDFEDRWILAIVGLIIATIALTLIYVKQSTAHDGHLALTVEQEKIYNFYSGWMRPKGPFQGVQHRKISCCNKTDCFPVAEIRVRDGVYRIKIEYPDGKVSGEYSVNPSIIESNQEDPRESPDGRSHACIIGGVVACFVEGSGI